MTPFRAEFNTVRAACKMCGWYRVVAYTGCLDENRALIKLRRSADASHLVHGSVIEVPVNMSIAEADQKYPGYRDLNLEAHNKGLHSVMKEFDSLFQDAVCPRCQSGEELRLESIVFHGREIRY